MTTVQVIVHNYSLTRIASQKVGNDLAEGPGVESLVHLRSCWCSSIAGVAPAPFLEGRSDTLIGAFTAANAHSDYSGACQEARAA